MALSDVLVALGQAVTSSINSAGITAPTQVYTGWPTAQELMPIINNGGYAVSVHALDGSKNITKYPKDFQNYSAPPANLVATLSHNTITFSGVSDVSYNVYAMIYGQPYVAAYVQTSASQSLSSIATAVAGAINALALTGITASAAGAVVTLSGGQFSFCNVGTNGLIAREVTRINRWLQVSVWAPDPVLRFAIQNAIMAGIGYAIDLFLNLPDGSKMFCRYMTDKMEDEHQVSYALFVHHIIFDAEYGVIEIDPATQIGEAQANLTMTSGLGNGYPTPTVTFDIG